MYKLLASIRVPGKILATSAMSMLNVIVFLYDFVLSILDIHSGNATQDTNGAVLQETLVI